MKKLSGSIGVDSGMVLICDPAYLGYPEFKRDIKTLMIGERQISVFEPVRIGTKDMYLGALVKPYFGDGRYPVWVETNDNGQVIKVEVQFHWGQEIKKKRKNDDPR